MEMFTAIDDRRELSKLSPQFSRKTLSSIINGKAGVSPEMAVRLSIAFNTSAESWLNQQTQFDLWQAEQHRGELDVKRLSAA